MDGLGRLAEETVAWFRADWKPRPDDYAALESVEVVELESDGPA